MKMKYDFSGWVTKNNVRCSDGRIIRRDAFAHCDGQIVPLVWNHKHNSPDNVVGNVLLENRPEGVYGYGAFNGTEAGKDAKELVAHGDISCLSIYANHLKQNGAAVLHGMIREVSLVLAGANPEAKIDSVIIHSDDTNNYNFGYDLDEDEVVICMGDEIELAHADGDSKEESSDEKSKSEDNKMTLQEVQDVYDNLTDKQREAVNILVGLSIEMDKEEKTKEAEVSHSEENTETEDAKEEPEVESEAESKTDEVEHSDDNYNEEEYSSMKKNVFDEASVNEKGQELTHADIQSIFDDIQRYGSLKNSVLAHGIENIDLLFPEAKAVTEKPEYIRRDTTWVGVVMNGVHPSPFARIKSLFADITGPEARAKGYIKGNYKEEEVFDLLKRETTPTTVYKKQTFDRDDLIDITGFDKVAWIRSEMRGMLDEELARAYLIGDGRSSASKDKINAQCIRPIWSDAELFTIRRKISLSNDLTPDQRAKTFIREVRKARKDYKGSGNLTMFTTEDMLTDCLLMEDNVGRIIYDTEAKLATALRVNRIVTVPVMENLTRVDENHNTLETLGIMVDMDDYRVGMDRGGEVTNYDDFDIDYNQQKYLIETRCSGALTKPFSAIVIEAERNLFHVTEPEDPNETVLGKKVSDIQSNVFVNDGFIQGTLKYVTGYTGYSGDPELQHGHYLVLKFDHTEGSDTKVSLIGGTSAPVSLDSDMNCVFRIANKNSQKVKVVTTLNGIEVENIYNLSSLKMLSE